MNMDISSLIRFTLLTSLSCLIMSCGGTEEETTESQKAPATKILPSFHDLKINFTEAGLGLGTVKIQPNSLVCNEGCTSNIAEDTQVELIATPKAGAKFIAWGDDCSGSDTCRFTMSSEHTVNVSFSEESSTYTLSVKETDGGSIKLTDGGTIELTNTLDECLTDCSLNIAENEELIFSATPETGYIFTSWSGACTGNSTCVITISEDKELIANFEQETEFSLSTEITTGGYISLQDTTLECVDSCMFNLEKAATISIVATPEYGYTFIKYVWDIHKLLIKPHLFTMVK